MISKQATSCVKEPACNSAPQGQGIVDQQHLLSENERLEASLPAQKEETKMIREQLEALTSRLDSNSPTSTQLVAARDEDKDKHYMSLHKRPLELEVWQVFADATEHLNDKKHSVNKPSLFMFHQDFGTIAHSIENMFGTSTAAHDASTPIIESSKDMNVYTPPEVSTGRRYSSVTTVTISTMSEELILQDVIVDNCPVPMRLQPSTFVSRRRSIEFSTCTRRSSALSRRRSSTLTIFAEVPKTQGMLQSALLQPAALEQALNKQKSQERRFPWKKLAATFRSSRRQSHISKDLLTVFNPEDLNALNRKFNAPMNDA